jgi:hypothetical protein
LPAYYCKTVREFINASTTEIVGELTLGHAAFGFPQVEREQVQAWEDEIACLKSQLVIVCLAHVGASDWGILLEYPIPRRQQRIDVVLLAASVIFVLEFKSSVSQSAWAGARQAEDYALDLAYFHAPSHDRVIMPVLVAPGVQTKLPTETTSRIRSLATVAPEALGTLLISVYGQESMNTEPGIVVGEWNTGLYRPVPTVIEAATALYAGMSVREITRSHSDEVNLTRTTEFVLRAISEAQTYREKIICFITGIPGAGKTLAGLNLVHNPEIRRDDRPSSVFLSGNGPLVKILREALARDFAQRKGASLRDARAKVSAFVQNIHHFVRDNLERSADQPSHENVIVFDEAQRAWDADRNLAKNKHRSAAWHVSEPEMVLRIMDRHQDWAAVIALVGGGQEIHEGEAGLAEWGRTLSTKYERWRVLASPEALHGGASLSGTSLFGSATPPNRVTAEEALHLKTSVRSHQAEQLADWVNHVLNGQIEPARELARSFERFPIALTRNLDEARSWLKKNTRGHRRCGLIASSGAARLRAQGIEISTGFRRAYPYERWFLDDRADVRSSYQLEVPATEFEIQGLELDVAGLCWGGDFVWSGRLKSWRTLRFTGKAWRPLRHTEESVQLQNKYRVLMTRAREGLIIFVPEGSSEDTTQDISAMNETATFLLNCGVGRASGKHVHAVLAD